MASALKSIFKQQVEALITQVEATSVWVSLSGGLDSVVLMHLLANWHADNACSLPMSAIHVDHGLSKNAQAWAQFCEAQCQQLSLPVKICQVRPKQGPRLSLEAEAREARYNAIQQQLPKRALLLTAHHLNDQSETFLQRLQRGSGPSGLSAMATVSELKPGLMVGRPLLSVSRDELAEYAEQQGLHWVEDESNQDLLFDRNFLRHQVLPLLRQRWPSIERTMARSARLCAEQELLLQEFVAADLAAAVSCENALNITYLRELTPLRQAYLLRSWLKQQGAQMPSEAQLSNMLSSLLVERQDASPEVCWSGSCVRRYRHQLYLVEQQSARDLTSLILPWDCRSSLVLPYGLGTLEVTRQVQGTADMPVLKLPQNECVSVRFRSGNPTCRPYGRKGSRPLKKLFHEYLVPPWQRESVPLIYYDDELVAAVGLWICEEFAQIEGEGGTFRLSRP
ncbi:tRNA lysidine(34) synthetase TilS [Corallincola holothuriorum]|uniref:tRNA(Ile)-lysidine synthase n=1 Tax=Corallincola holothuriorum TaxID=2282215 RepID=A0A368NG46_9GAMM|nr:tRNA lysidine(34) synthetase TilS [Corallincola holothuriorum]RCU48883.1 tRNA lysidine(34) synthetase TilS [Corallincola holothuriorum]